MGFPFRRATGKKLVSEPNKEEDLTLKLLEAIDERSDVSQRRLSLHLGVALGLTNSYLKRCVRKGLVKVRAAPANRYLYYLTPKGFAEKSRLTAKYLRVSFDFYRSAGDSLKEVYDHCRDNGWNSVLLCGISELAEIALIRSQEVGVNVIGVYSPAADHRACFFNLGVYRSPEETPDSEACLLTDLSGSFASYHDLFAQFDSERVLIPNILRFRYTP